MEKYTPLDREHPMVPGGDLDDYTREALRETLASMASPVEVELFVSDRCFYCVESEKLLRQFEELSPRGEDGRRKLRLKVVDLSKNPEEGKKRGVYRTPTVSLLEGYARWTGIPSGEEIRSLVETIMRISEGESGLEEYSKRAVRRLASEVEIEVIVTPLCPYCPYAVVMANMLAYESYKLGQRKVKANTIEAFENADIADYYGVVSVPAIVINKSEMFVGLPDERDLAEALLRLGSRGA